MILQYQLVHSQNTSCHKLNQRLALIVQKNMFNMGLMG